MFNDNFVGSNGQAYSVTLQPVVVGVNKEVIVVVGTNDALIVTALVNGGYYLATNDAVLLVVVYDYVVKVNGNLNGCA